MRENFTIEDKKTEKIYWISRAVAVTGVIMASDGNDFWFLLERRGPGCPDNVGKLCCVCGYLNWDETRLDALKRETYEETGLKIDNENCTIHELETIDDPTRDTRQNVVTRYLIWYAQYTKLKELLDSGVINTNTKSRGGEEGEVSEFLLLSESQIKSLPLEEFAFNHKEMILEVLNKIFQTPKILYKE